MKESVFQKPAETSAAGGKRKRKEARAEAGDEETCMERHVHGKNAGKRRSAEIHDTTGKANDREDGKHIRSNETPKARP